MLLTSTASEAYGPVAHGPEQTASEEPSLLARVPKLFWAGVSLFTLNLLVLGGSVASPELNVSAYGVQIAGKYRATDRPSPFTEVVNTARPQPVRTAARVTPVIVQEPVMGDLSAPADLVIPRYSQSALKVYAPNGGAPVASGLRN